MFRGISVAMRRGLVVALLVSCVTARGAEVALLPLHRLGVEMPIPEGFLEATEFPGLQHPDGVGILVLTFPDPIEASIAEYSPANLKRDGMTLLEEVVQDPGVTDRKTVKLSHQDESGVELIKWVTVFGDSKSTTLVLCEFPSALREKFDEAGKTAVTNVRAFVHDPLQDLEPVDFAIPDSSTLKLAGGSQDTRVYTVDGRSQTKSPEEPRLTIAKSSHATQGRDVADVAKKCLEFARATEIQEMELVKPDATDPQWKTCEIVATGRDKKSGTPRFVYQKLIIAPHANYLVQAWAGVEQREKLLPEFRRLADGLRLLTKEELAAASAEHLRLHMGPPSDRAGVFGRSPRELGRPPRAEPLTGPTPAQRESIRQLQGRMGRGERMRGGLGGALRDQFQESPTEAPAKYPRGEAARQAAKEAMERRRSDDAAREMEARRRHFRRGDGFRDDQSLLPFAVVNIEDDRPEQENTFRFGGGRGRIADMREDAAPMPQLDLPRPPQAMPVFGFAPTAVQTSPAIGREEKPSFEELAPRGGLLVGAVVVVGDSFGGSVQAIEPIFQVVRKYERSTLHGTPGANVKLLLAPPGYAVGGVQVGAGLLMDAMRLVYMPVEGDRLNVDNREYSEWVGGAGGGTSECVSDGSLVVGLGGAYERDAMRLLTLAYVPPGDVELATKSKERSSNAADAKGASDPDKRRDETIRRWTSVDGKFNVVGRLVEFDGKVATIVKEDGERVKSPVEKLSPKDQEYLEKMDAK